MFNIPRERSQREVSTDLDISRTTLRKALSMDKSVKLSILEKVSRYCNQYLEVLVYPIQNDPDSSTVATGFRIARDGQNSWKIHLMDMVDEFRTSGDARLLLLPPVDLKDQKLNALIAATTIELCYERKLNPPDWTVKLRPLAEPWFVSGIESLKASALLESPYAFRSKNIFVLDNFLTRA